MRFFIGMWYLVQRCRRIFSRFPFSVHGRVCKATLKQAAEPARLPEKVAPEAGPRLLEAMESPSTLTENIPSPSTGAAGAVSLPEGVRAGNENLVLLTAPAGKKVAALIEREKQGRFLRIAISGGGCNGLSYKMKFVAEPKRGDILVPSAGIQVVVDSKSALYLKGTHVDYSSALVSGGFKFSNPNAKASCSCGESFSV